MVDVVRLWRQSCFYTVIVSLLVPLWSAIQVFQEMNSFRDFFCYGSGTDSDPKQKQKQQQQQQQDEEKTYSDDSSYWSWTRYDNARNWFGYGTIPTQNTLKDIIDDLYDRVFGDFFGCAQVTVGRVLNVVGCAVILYFLSKFLATSCLPHSVQEAAKWGAVVFLAFSFDWVPSQHYIEVSSCAFLFYFCATVTLHVQGTNIWKKLSAKGTTPQFAEVNRSLRWFQHATLIFEAIPWIVGATYGGLLFVSTYFL